MPEEKESKEIQDLYRMSRRYQGGKISLFEYMGWLIERGHIQSAEIDLDRFEPIRTGRDRLRPIGTEPVRFFRFSRSYMEKTTVKVCQSPAFGPSLGARWRYIRPIVFSIYERNRTGSARKEKEYPCKRPSLGA